MARDFLGDLDRKAKALKLRLQGLKENGDDRLSSRNEVIAGNETAYERGCFRADEEIELKGLSSKDQIDALLAEPDWTDDMMRGFIVRTREAALHANLNTIDMVDRVRAIEKKIDRLNMWVGLALALLLLLAFPQLFWWR